PRPARLVFPDLVAASLHQRVLLQIEALIRCADPHVTNQHFRPRCVAQTTCEVVQRTQIFNTDYTTAKTAVSEGDLRQPSACAKTNVCATPVRSMVVVGTTGEFLLGVSGDSA